MKQIDRIRKMNAEELAVVILNSCDYCIYNGRKCIEYYPSCVDGIKAWLESEVENE